MTAAQPTILATSAGYLPHPRLDFTFGPMMRFAADLAGAGDRPRICHVGTASGDNHQFQRAMEEAARDSGYELHHLSLFPMPNVDDVEAYLRSFDVVWVNGGSVANLLAVWRVHGLDVIFRRLWEDGVVLAGVSAGSICWHTGGTTDSFGPELAPVTNGLGFIPHANGVHYDSEERRRPLVHELVGNGTLGTTYCTDDGVGLLYHGTELVDIVTQTEGAGAYVVRRDPATGQVTEERLEPRLLGRD